MKSLFVLSAFATGFFMTPFNASAALRNGRYDINVSGTDADRLGDKGGNAGNVAVTLSYTDAAKTQVKISGRITRGGSARNFEETFASTELKLVAITADGGAGGNGYSGSDGSDGANGRDGSNGRNGNDGCPGEGGARGEDGGNGEDGQDGGAGGDGGSGGRGGKIVVTVAPEQTELLLLVKTSNRAGRGGEGGSGGHGGRGGRGGTGGRGGSGGRGTCVDSEGRPVGGNDGSSGWSGSDGRSGSDGHDGASGSSGSAGASGSHAYEVGTQKYGSPFRLAITNLKFVDENDDGILQPGEKLHLLALTVQNRGEMASPAGQTIKLTMFDNSILKVKAAPANLAISEVLASGAAKNLNFSKGEAVLEAVPKISAIGEAANLSLKIAINSIAISDDFESGFALHWPVAIVAGAERSAGFFGAAKSLKFSVKNVGTKGIGPGGAQPVDVQISWSSREIQGSDVTVTLKDGRSFRLKDPALLSNISIPAKSSLGLTVGINVQNSRKLLTASGSLRVELRLKDPASGQPDKVDAATTKLDLAYDLRPLAIARRFDLRDQEVTCRYPNTIFKNQTLTWLSLTKAKGAEQVKIQFATAGLFQNDASPVYTVSAFDFAPYAKALSGSPTPASIMRFLNENVVSQTHRGPREWIIARCGR